MPPERGTAEQQRRSIAQINRTLRSILEAETLEHFFWVAGKVDRFYKSDRGHIYFDLVDGDLRIRCMLREEQSGDLSFELRNHLEIEIYGDIHFYERHAEAQINVLNARSLAAMPDDVSAIESLRAEGLFPPRRKAAPAHISRIGLITSRSSRAIGDFENAYQGAGDRAVLAPLTWQYVQLEGERAQQSILDGIVLLESQDEIDVIAIIRGGGRNPEMAVFDQLDILRAIARSSKFIVTGIGHQRDHCLADDFADHIAATPTAAATFLAQLCLRSAPALHASQAPRTYAEPIPPAAFEPPPFDAGPPPGYDAPPHEDDWSGRMVSPQPSPSRGYKLLAIALLLLAIAAVAFLGYAVLQSL